MSELNQALVDRMQSHLGVMLKQGSLNILGHSILAHLAAAGTTIKQYPNFVLVDDPDQVQTIKGDWVVVADCHIKIPSIYAGVVILHQPDQLTVQHIVCQHLIVLGGSDLHLPNVDADQITVLGTNNLALGKINLKESAIYIVNRLALEHCHLTGGDETIVCTNQLVMNTPILEPDCQYIFALPVMSTKSLQKKLDVLAGHQHLLFVDADFSAFNLYLKLHIPTIGASLKGLFEQIPAANGDIPTWKICGLLRVGQQVIYDRMELINRLVTSLPFLRYMVTDPEGSREVHGATYSVWDILDSLQTQ